MANSVQFGGLPPEFPTKRHGEPKHSTSHVKTTRVAENVPFVAAVPETKLAVDVHVEKKDLKQERKDLIDAMVSNGATPERAAFIIDSLY